MTSINITDFDPFFRELHDHDPYPWQRRLAERAVEAEWPGAIDLPTGSGKTACIDIAIFALACQASLPIEQRTAPRRIFFCVNRRVIVDEAFQRARQIAIDVWNAERDGNKPVLHKVANALRHVAGAPGDSDTPPLDALEVRGGIYRDNRWARSISQPTVVCTTLDQLGSRLLFRGYGVSQGAAPIQAALVAYDSLVLLDEAHISTPFLQTLQHVQSYLDPEKWAREFIGVRPMTVVPMTATPSEDMQARGIVCLDDHDRQVPHLLTRLKASKPAELPPPKKVAAEAVKAATDSVSDTPVAVGIIVNRISTARAIYDDLRALREAAKSKKPKIPSDAVIELVIGSMRPLDRDQQSKRLQPLVGSKRPQPTSTQTSFVIATQCLEVGADYDFDVLITECASLDALRQRFGRLNRAGRDIQARGVILINKKDAKPEAKLDDKNPSYRIYGNAMARTWNWLNFREKEGVVDFGIDEFERLLKQDDDSAEPTAKLHSPSTSLNAPVMLPAYIDLWCQTSPRPSPDPEPSLFIHGPQGSEPDVQVCWRADLVDDEDMSRAAWCDVVALAPPTSAECIRIPISRLRRWLSQQPPDEAADHGDVLGIPEPENGGKQGSKTTSSQVPQDRVGVLWRGMRNSQLLASPSDLRPGDTLVLPTSLVDSKELGHFPEETANTDDAAATTQLPITDHAERAWHARDRALLRIHPSLRDRFPDSAYQDLLNAIQADDPPTRQLWRELLVGFKAQLQESDRPLPRILDHLAIDMTIEHYPDGRGVVLVSRRPIGSSTDWFLPAMDDGDDDGSRARRVFLQDHLHHVEQSVANTLENFPFTSLEHAFRLAAQYHDLGKADERFQAMLHRADRTDAWLMAGVANSLLAKSESLPKSLEQAREARERAGLPNGFRHEMLSVQLAEHLGISEDPRTCELVLHLIGAHHGYARPFAPVVIDDELPAIDVEVKDQRSSVESEQRQEWVPSHRIDSGITDRFWNLTRHFGWWGLAYLEAVLRLADQQASAAEAAGRYDHEASPESVETNA